MVPKGAPVNAWGSYACLATMPFSILWGLDSDGRLATGTYSRVGIASRMGNRLWVT